VIAWTSVINKPALIIPKGSVGELVKVQSVVTAVKGLVKEKLKVATVAAA